MNTRVPLTVLARSDRRTTADVEVVIPVFNEETVLEASVVRLHDYLRARFPLTWVLTIVDNASMDSTWGVACRLANEYVGVQAIRLN
jgi:hypothetical protein